MSRIQCLVDGDITLSELREERFLEAQGNRSSETMASHAKALHAAAKSHLASLDPDDEEQHDEIDKTGDLVSALEDYLGDDGDGTEGDDAGDVRGDSSPADDSNPHNLLNYEAKRCKSKAHVLLECLEV